MSNLDTRDFDKGMAELGRKVKDQTMRALNRMGDELLRLSTFEVPHDIGLLQGSGHVDPEGDEVLVSYNKVYAARLHEHPEYKFQKGRKGKYLEDPMKHNEVALQGWFADTMGAIF